MLPKLLIPELERFHSMIMKLSLILLSFSLITSCTNMPLGMVTPGGEPKPAAELDNQVMTRAEPIEENILAEIKALINADSQKAFNRCINVAQGRPYAETLDNLCKEALHNLVVGKNAVLPISQEERYAILFQCAACKFVQSIALLEEQGFNINQKDSYGNTILMRHLLENNIEIARFLAENTKINVNEKNNEGQNPIRYLALLNNKKYLEIFVQAGADINEQDGNAQRTILHDIAAVRADAVIMATLIEAGADITIKDNSGKTALDLLLEQCFYLACMPGQTSYDFQKSVKDFIKLIKDIKSRSAAFCALIEKLRLTPRKGANKDQNLVDHPIFEGKNFKLILDFADKDESFLNIANSNGVTPNEMIDTLFLLWNQQSHA